MTTDPGKPSAFARALRRGVTLSAVLAMKRIGCEVLPSKGPVAMLEVRVPFYRGEIRVHDLPVNCHFALTFHPTQPMTRLAIEEPALLLKSTNLPA